MINGWATPLLSGCTAEKSLLAGGHVREHRGGDQEEAREALEHERVSRASPSELLAIVTYGAGAAEPSHLRAHDHRRYPMPPSCASSLRGRFLVYGHDA